MNDNICLLGQGVVGVTQSGENEGVTYTRVVRGESTLAYRMLSPRKVGNLTGRQKRG